MKRIDVCLRIVSIWQVQFLRECDRVPRGDMVIPIAGAEPTAKFSLDELHSPADSEYRQSLLDEVAEQRPFSFISKRGLSDIVTSGKNQCLKLPSFYKFEN